MGAAGRVELAHLWEQQEFTRERIALAPILSVEKKFRDHDLDRFKEIDRISTLLQALRLPS